MTKGLRILAWMALALVLAATVGPIGLRPHTPWSPNFERVAAFAVLGVLFALAYPRRWFAVAAMLVVAAGLFEVGQYLIPDRHPSLRDFAIKAVGGGGGIAIGIALHRFRRNAPPA